MSKILYLSAVGIIAATILATGAADLWLDLTTDQATITDYLRECPQAFWGPVVAVIVLIIVLALHLFGGD